MNVVEFAAREQPPITAEVPIRQDVKFTANGGHGEPGRRGEDGQNGMNGTDGIGATRTSDATVSLLSLFVLVEINLGVYETLLTSAIEALGWY